MACLVTESSLLCLGDVIPIGRQSLPVGAFAVTGWCERVGLPIPGFTPAVNREGLYELDVLPHSARESLVPLATPSFGPSSLRDCQAVCRLLAAAQTGMFFSQSGIPGLRQFSRTELGSN